MKIVKNIDDFKVGSRICLYGAGEIGISLLLLLRKKRPDIEIVCFADLFRTGKTYGVSIIHPDDLLSKKYQYDSLVICSLNYKEQIEEKLNAIGIKNYCFLHPIFNSQEIEFADSSNNQNHPAQKSLTSNILYAFYDRAVAPDGFDIIAFIFMAEMERIRLGCDLLHPVIVPAPADLFIKKGKEILYEEQDEGIETSSRNNKTVGWWERNILIPCCWMMPSCSQITVCSSRKEALLLEKHVASNIYPAGYTVTHPTASYSWPRVIRAIDNNPGVMPTFRATEKACDYVSAWLLEHAGEKKVIAITLRELSMHLQRNSNIKAWADFARAVKKEGFFPVFIRDTTVALNEQPEELDDFLVFREGPWNMELRMALYELSYLNMFVNSGPAIFAHFNKFTRYLMFIKKQQGVFEVSEDHFKAEGITDGQMPGATKFQRTIWHEDSFANIIRAFEHMRETISGEVEKQ